jgi:hypothetical protein
MPPLPGRIMGKRGSREPERKLTSSCRWAFTRGVACGLEGRRTWQWGFRARVQQGAASGATAMRCRALRGRFDSGPCSRRLPGSMPEGGRKFVPVTSPGTGLTHLVAVSVQTHLALTEDGNKVERLTPGSPTAQQLRRGGGMGNRRPRSRRSSMRPR